MRTDAQVVGAGCRALLVVLLGAHGCRGGGPVAPLDASVLVDECAAGLDDCDRDPVATCRDADELFNCYCPDQFTGDGHGVDGCLYDNPTLASLGVSEGTLTPLFMGSITRYQLALPRAVDSVSFTPVIAVPTRAVIRVDGTVVPSGSESAPIALTRWLMSSTVDVVSESGTGRSYAVAIGRVPQLVGRPESADQFRSPLVVSEDGRTIAVHVQRGLTSSVDVFRETGTVWAREARLESANLRANDGFGEAMAISADGAVLAVGARQESSRATGIDGDATDTSMPFAGAAYVFRRTGTTWSQEAYVKASNTDADDYFGWAVALSSDGVLLAIGAPGEGSAANGVDGDQADDSTHAAGAVYLFRQVGGTWSQAHYVKASNVSRDSAFGSAVALASDGSTLAVGASYEGRIGRGIDPTEVAFGADQSGAAYVFDGTGDAWTQTAYIKASNARAGAWFGERLALSMIGTTLAVGARREAGSAPGINGDESDQTTFEAGAVYVFFRRGGAWAQEAYVKASNPGARDAFGSELSLAADGNTLAVGAPIEQSGSLGIGGAQDDDSRPSAGAAYVYLRRDGMWAQHAYVKPPTAAALGAFGGALGLAVNGDRLVIGAVATESQFLFLY